MGRQLLTSMVLRFGVCSSSAQDEQRVIAPRVQLPQFLGHPVRFVAGARADGSDHRELRGTGRSDGGRRSSSQTSGSEVISG